MSAWPHMLRRRACVKARAHPRARMSSIVCAHNLSYPFTPPTIKHKLANECSAFLPSQACMPLAGKWNNASGILMRKKKKGLFCCRLLERSFKTANAIRWKSQFNGLFDFSGWKISFMNCSCSFVCFSWSQIRRVTIAAHTLMVWESCFDPRSPFFKL